MKFEFDAAIFDMDGTLTDTMPFWRFTALEYALNHGFPLDLDYVARMYTEPSGRLLSSYAESVGVKLDWQDTLKELESYMNRHYIEAGRTKPHVKEFLDCMKAKGIRMCVATGSPREYARNALDKTGITDYFEFITDHYETEYTKSDPIYFKNLAQRLGVDPEKCILFEDSLYSMKSAKSAGMQICAVEDGSQANDKDEIIRICDIYIKDFSELL